MLILASTSRYRAQLLERLGLPFDVMAPGVEESPLLREVPLERAQRLALAKATAVSTLHPDATVIGSDQVAVCKGEVLGKPGDARECREQLQRLSGSTAIFHTALAVLDGARQATVQVVDTTTVYFRALEPREIERYVEIDRPLDCAGSFKSEALGIALFTRIVSEDPTALIGLPLIALARALRQVGYELP